MADEIILSLFPFATGWLGESHFAAAPSVLYGVVLLMAAIAYRMLQKSLIAVEGAHSAFQQAVRNDWKEKTSLALYFIAVIIAFRMAWMAQAIYVGVALLSLIPDRRIEHVLRQQQ
jgi:uncharacterized membrane protein